MDYPDFSEIFNRHIFERSKADLIAKIAQYPERYTGLFRPTHPKAKIIQNLLQSHEIRFGDAFETLIREILRDNGFTNKERHLISRGENLELDQIFSKDGQLFFVEQKIRDDHDSTKKRGQVDNFDRKAESVIESYSEFRITGFFYFIDDSFKKNINYYKEEISSLSSRHQVDLHLCYGSELFDFLGLNQAWDEILGYLEKWKKEVPEIPDINFDTNALASVEEIKDLPPSIYVKLLSNDKLDGVLRVLFPENKTLNLLKNYFLEMDRENRGKQYKKLSELCEQRIIRISSNS